MAATSARWWEALEREPITDVARALGLTVTPPRNASGGTLSPCPSCNATKRHTQRRDRRFAVGIRRDGRGAHCFQCGAGFTASTLVCFVLEGKGWKQLHDAARDRVRAWVLQYTGGSAARPRPVVLHDVSPPEAPTYPPLEEVQAFWRSCSAVTARASVSHWLRSFRGIDPELVVLGDLARAIPEAGAPAWAGHWDRVGNKLVVPLYDSKGEIRSVLGRAVRPNVDRKSIAPTGFARAGLVMADGNARAMLVAGELPPSAERRIIIVEGEPDFLTAATATATDGDALPAVIGVVQGSWSAELAARIPSGVRLVISVHVDDAGEKYARAIWNSVAKRASSGAIAVERWRP